MTTTLMFFRKSSANLVLTLSTVLSICCFYFYLRIIFNDFRRDIDLNSEPSANLTSSEKMIQIGKYEELAFLVNTYTNLQAINSWLIFIRLLFEFGFSKEISFLIDVIYEALFDILFFMLTFAIILLGFAVDGYLMFGAITTDFKDLGLAFLQSLLWMITGQTTSDSTDENLESGTKAVFFIALTIVGLLILLKMFMAIIDGQYMDSIATAITEEDSNFFKVILTLLKAQYKEEEKAAVEFNKAKANPQQEQGFFKKIIAKFSSLPKEIRYNIFLRLLRFLFADKRPVQKKTRPPQIKARMGKFIINLPAEDEPRASNLEDIQLYLTEQHQIKEQIPELSKDIEDELTMPNYWMNFLEETLSQATDEGIKLASYGIGIKDFPLHNSPEDTKLQAKFMEDLEELALKEDIPKEQLLQKFVEDKAILSYQTHFKETQSQDQEYMFLEVSNYLQVIYQFSLKTEEDMFDYSDESLCKFWNALKFEHQCQLWAGDKMHLLSNNIRHCLWVQMKFHVSAFQPLFSQQGFALGRKNIFFRILISLKDLNLKHIGMKELEFIWQKKFGGDANLENQDQTQIKINTNHINFIENFIRGKNSNMIVELQKFKTIEEKAKFLQSQKHICQDSKLMLWLLTPLPRKAEIILRIQNPVLLQFTMLMIFEEVYDNFNILTRLETQFEQELINKIYMFFFSFSQFEALQAESKLLDTTKLKNTDPDLISYISFLEKQVESTNQKKREYLDKIQEVLKTENPKQNPPTAAHLTEASTFRIVTLVTENDEGTCFIKEPKIGHEEFIFNEEESKEEDLESFRPLKEEVKENISLPLPLPLAQSSNQRQKRKAALSEINLNSPSNIELPSIAELRKQRQGKK